MSIERSVAKLEAQQEAMAQDVSEMKSALTSIAQTLQDLSSMEQRQVHLTETVTRAHKRIDEIQAIVKDAALDPHTNHSHDTGHDDALNPLVLGNADLDSLEPLLVVLYFVFQCSLNSINAFVGSAYCFGQVNLPLLHA